ncbi:MAG: iron-sulfur cluster-binding domain-containing protein [Clostridia bacterium]
MNKKIHIKANGLADIVTFLKLAPNRRKILNKGIAKKLPTTYKTNEVAAALHPKKQVLKVVEKQEISNDTTLFIFNAVEKQASYFRAGQYLSLAFDIDGRIVKRPYSIASSPNEALKNEYRIAIKKVKEGYISNWATENLNIGDTIEASAPEGNFYYEPMRDNKTIVGVAGGSGITPFLSLAKAIADKTEIVNLILLYGARTIKDLLFKDAFDKLANENSNIKIVYVLSNEKVDKYENGFITAELIKKYAPSEFSIFLCGPSAMYNFVGKEIDTLKIEKKNVRFELFGETKNPLIYDDFPKELADKYFSIKVNTNESVFDIEAKATETVLVALERNGIAAPSHCRSGECGFCRSKLVSGKLFVVPNGDGRRKADKKFGYFHPCSSFPLSNLEIILPI